MARLNLTYPVTPVFLNQGWGLRPEVYAQFGMKGHNGLDFRAYDGQAIHAAHDGEVTYAGEDGSSGLLCVIRTTEKFEYNGKDTFFKTLYCHIKKGGFKVKPGDKVKAGQVIALADNTGFSSGTHLHFGLKPVYKGEKDWEWFNVSQGNGYSGAIDPTPYLMVTLPKKAWQILEEEAARLQTAGNLVQSNIVYAVAQLVKSFMP